MLGKKLSWKYSEDFVLPDLYIGIKRVDVQFLCFIFSPLQDLDYDLHNSVAITIPLKGKLLSLQISLYHFICRNLKMAKRIL